MATRSDREARRLAVGLLACLGLVALAILVGSAIERRAAATQQRGMERLSVQIAECNRLLGAVRGSSGRMCYCVRGDTVDSMFGAP